MNDFYHSSIFKDMKISTHKLPAANKQGKYTPSFYNSGNELSYFIQHNKQNGKLISVIQAYRVYSNCLFIC